MKQQKNKQAISGATVFLSKLPAGFLRGLPKGDKKAISEIVGKPILLVRYDEDGRAELKFTDSNGIIHFIYVKPSFLQGKLSASRKKERRKKEGRPKGVNRG